MWKWCAIDEWGIQWLRDHPTTFVSLARECLPSLIARFNLRRAKPLSRTKLGLHVEEYREFREHRALHVREFDDHIEVHTDFWNPDWNAWAFVRHLFADTEPFQVGIAVIATTLCLRYLLG